MRGGGFDVERLVVAAAYADDFRVVIYRRPGAVGLLELGAVAGATEVLDVEVLDVCTEVGETPGYVGVAADDEERRAG